MNNNCIFCKIASGDIPSYKIYEDDFVYAFLDISQSTKGHTLLITKKHFDNLYKLDETTSSNLFKVVPKIANALKKTFDPIGLNIIVNTDKPLQEVFHFHLHIIPRYIDDGLIIKGKNNSKNMTSQLFKELQLKIINNL